jgi:peptidyl-prolyl cis-trans isomerase C
MPLVRSHLAALGLTCCFATSFAQAPRPEEKADSHIAAAVNGEAIPLTHVDAIVSRLPTRGTPLTASQTRRLRQEVLGDLIEDVLLKQFLRRHGPAVEAAELEAHFKALAAAMRKQGRTPADFYRETGQTEAQAREAWETQLRFNKFVEQRATDAELRKYHEANRDVFDDVRVRANHIVLRVPAAAPPGERVAAREKLAAVRADIAAGKLSFADAARKFSMDSTARQGGDLGLVGRQDPTVDEAVTRAAFALKPGEVSAPTDSEFGVHLVQAVERTAGKPVPFEKVIELVRESYAEELRRRIVAEQRKSAAIQVTLP